MWVMWIKYHAQSYIMCIIWETALHQACYISLLHYIPDSHNEEKRFWWSKQKCEPLHAKTPPSPTKLDFTCGETRDQKAKNEFGCGFIVIHVSWKLSYTSLEYFFKLGSPVHLQEHSEIYKTIPQLKSSSSKFYKKYKSLFIAYCICCHFFWSWQSLTL